MQEQLYIAMVQLTALEKLGPNTERATNWVETFRISASSSSEAYSKAEAMVPSWARDHRVISVAPAVQPVRSALPVGEPEPVFVEDAKLVDSPPDCNPNGKTYLKVKLSTVKNALYLDVTEYLKEENYMSDKKSMTIDMDLSIRIISTRLVNDPPGHAPGRYMAITLSVSEKIGTSYICQDEWTEYIQERETEP